MGENECTVGTSQVRDIRDTLEHYEADGYLLAVSTRVSAPLLDRPHKLETGFPPSWSFGVAAAWKTNWWRIVISCKNSATSSSAHRDDPRDG